VCGSVFFYVFEFVWRVLADDDDAVKLSCRDPVVAKN